MALISCRSEQFGTSLHQPTGVHGSYAASQASAASLVPLHHEESLNESTHDDNMQSPTYLASDELATNQEVDSRK